MFKRALMFAFYFVINTLSFLWALASMIYLNLTLWGSVVRVVEWFVGLVGSSVIYWLFSKKKESKNNSINSKSKDNDTRAA